MTRTLSDLSPSARTFSDSPTKYHAQTKSRRLFVFAWLFAACSPRSEIPIVRLNAGTIAANDRNIRYIGQFDHTLPLAPRLAWPASTIEVRFEADGIGVMLIDELNQTPDWTAPPAVSRNFFNAQIDGGAPVIVAANQVRSTHWVAKGLAKGAHTLRLLKRTEAKVGTTTFLGIALPQGGKLLPPKKRQRLILIVGDSMSTGYGNEGADEKCNFTPATQNAADSYGVAVADDVNADLWLLAYSGRGVYRNYDGSLVNPVPTLIRRTIPDEANSPPVRAQRKADAVLINLGYNDFVTGDPGNVFAERYDALVSELRKAHPRAHLFCAVGAMLKDSWPKEINARTRVTEELRAIVKRRHDIGDNDVHFLEFREPQEEDGYGCDWHPSKKTHQHMAHTFREALRETLQW